MLVALSIVTLLLLTAVLAAWALLIQFAAQQGRILMRLQSLEERAAPAADTGVCGGEAVQEAPPELPIGAPVPPFSLRGLAGEQLGLDEFRGRRVLLVNWSPACGFCERIAPELGKLHGALRKQNTELVLVASGDVVANRRLATSHHLDCPILLNDGRPAEAFGPIGTPAAYLVDEEGRVASPRALGSDEVPALARQAAGRGAGLRLRSLSASRIRRDGLPPGTPAPDFTLSAVNGGSVSLGDYRGRRVLLVFTHPHCPPCDELAPQLARLHRDIGDDELGLIMVGRGEPDENRRKCDEHGIEFPVVVQRGSKLSRQYGIFSWPVAFLVDERGVIAENVASGTDAILALAHRGARAGEEAPMEV